MRPLRASMVMSVLVEGKAALGGCEGWRRRGGGDVCGEPECLTGGGFCRSTGG